MMHSETAVTIAAPPRAIYDVVANVEGWPRILPHYRYVRRTGDGSLAMAARRGWIPVRWWARVEGDPLAPALRFRHVAGWTRGMEVRWSFTPCQGGTRVAIVHDLDFRVLPLAREWIARRVIGDFFVDAIARRTLACVKALMEARPV
ncbi:MAG: SRPBCC family protein [bacterium]|nr:SRPBCC family protein [bacterium]